MWCPSHFLYLYCANKTKTFLYFCETTKLHTKNCSVYYAVLQWTEKERKLCAIVD